MASKKLGFKMASKYRTVHNDTDDVIIVREDNTTKDVPSHERTIDQTHSTI